jgi:pimeloyl-ACP methyl ester carboxylesterase
VRFFSGFLFIDEKELFKKYFIQNDFIVVGFSYGAQKALEFTLASQSRIDRLILLSPAFFQDRDEIFRRTQKIYFSSNKERYSKNFLQSVIYPSKNRDIERYLCEGSQEELNALLEYKWSQDKLARVQSKGVNIEVFLGTDDVIIDTTKVSDFFSKNATVYLIKEAGHLLDIE